MYIAPYPKDDARQGQEGRTRRRCSPAWRQGIVALYQKCVHLGCRVPWCQTSQWFECPCHGSQYNRVGEKKGGPAPRGLDRFAIDGRRRRRSSSTPARSSSGPPIGTNTTGQEAEGPHCIVGRGRTDARSPATPGRRRRASVVLIAVVIVGFVVRRHQHPRRPSRRSARRSSSRRTASRTSTTRSSRARKLDRTLHVRPARSVRRRAIGLPLYWLDEPGRQAGAVEDFERQVRRRAARRLFAPTAEGGFNCAVLPRRQGRRRSGATYTITDADGRLRRQVTGRRRRSTPCCCATAATRSRYILTYGRPFSPMPAWGVDRRRSAQRPADPEPHRLPRVDPAHAEAGAGRGQEGAGEDDDREGPDLRRAQDRRRQASTGERCKSSTTTVDTSTARTVEDRRRGPVQHGLRRRLRRRRLLVRPLPHARAGPTTQKTKDGKARSGPPLDQRDRPSSPARRSAPTSQTDFVCTGSEQGKLYGSNGQGTGRMPGFCITPGREGRPSRDRRGRRRRRTTAGIPTDGRMMTEDAGRARSSLYERSL